MAAATATATPPVNTMRERVKEKLGIIPNFLKLDVTKIGHTSYRVNVWVRTEGGEFGAIKTAIIADSFFAYDEAEGIKFVSNDGKVR